MGDDKLAACRQRIITAAVNYARAKSIGRFLNADGAWEMLGSNAGDYADRFTRDMQAAALDLVAEMTVAPPGDGHP